MNDKVWKILLKRKTIISKVFSGDSNIKRRGREFLYL